MIHTLVTCVFTLLAFALAFFDFRGWRRDRRIWYMISLVAAAIAAAAFWLSWGLGFLLLVPAALLFALGLLFKAQPVKAE
jgi:hypothetical protein